MIITGIFHAAIKTNDLKATVDFYTKVLGLREAPRPDFGYPGAWLACPTGTPSSTSTPAGRPSARTGGRRTGPGPSTTSRSARTGSTSSASRLPVKSRRILLPVKANVAYPVPSVGLCRNRHAPNIPYDGRRSATWIRAVGHASGLTEAPGSRTVTTL